jgi:hypothetical protein
VVSATEEVGKRCESLKKSWVIIEINSQQKLSVKVFGEKAWGVKNKKFLG